MKHNKKLVLVGLALLAVVITALPLMGCKNDSVPPTPANTLAIVFDSRGGSEVARQTVEVGNRVTKPTEPTKKGANFDGWYLEGDTEEYDFSTPVVKNMMLYAKWVYDKEISPENVKGIFEGVAKGETVALKVTGEWTEANMKLLKNELLKNEGIKIRLDLSSTAVTSIGEYAFESCDSLASIDLPASLTSIGGYAFEFCDSLASIDLSSTALTSIGDRAFFDCDSLESIDLPASIETIGNNAFSDCDSLASIDLSSTALTSIGEYAFESCDSLGTVTVRATNPPTLGSDAFYGVPLAEILVPSDKVTTYKEKEGWKEYSDIIKAIPESTA